MVDVTNTESIKKFTYSVNNLHFLKDLSRNRRTYK